MSTRWAAAWIILSVLAAVPAGGQAEAAKAHREHEAVVVFVNDLSFDDFARLARYPQMSRWLAAGRYGAMSIRPPGARTEANAYLQMGSGGQALYTEKAGTAHHWEERLPTGETAGERYALLAGGEERGNPPGKIVFPGIFRLWSEQSDKPFTARIGLLGSLLKQSGVRAALYGNADMGDVKRRNAALFAMDEAGIIPSGDVSTRTLEPRPDYPFGVRTDYRYLLERLRGQQHSRLIAVELGDMARLYALQPEMNPDVFARHRERVLADLDAFLGAVLADRPPERLVMLAAPAVNRLAQQEKSLLTPVALWNGALPGPLTSATTRQTGVVSGLDVLPTLLDWLGVPLPEGIVGHIMTGVPDPDRAVGLMEGSLSAMPAARDEQAEASVPDRPEWVAGNPATDRFAQFLAGVERIHHLHRTRSPVLTSYITAQVAVLLAALGIWLWGRFNRTRSVPHLIRRLVRLSLLALLFIPLLFLLEPLWGLSLPPVVLLCVMFLTAFAFALAVDRLDLPAALMVTGGGTAAALLADGFFGGQVMSRSYMGYDPVIGARFYGMGNEYEGVLIGAALLFVASLYEKSRGGRGDEPDLGRSGMLPRWTALAVFAVVLYYMAAPRLGTNAGGCLAGMVGFGVALARLESWRLGRRGWCLLAGGLAAGIGVLMAANLMSSYPLTHVGRVAQDIVSGNWTEVGHIVERKLEMNLKLLRFSAWNKVFAASLLVIGLLSVRPDRYLRRMAAYRPHLVNGFSGIVAGSVAGLLLNDSGIVSAATCILFFAAPALYAALAEQEGPSAAH